MFTDLSHLSLVHRHLMRLWGGGVAAKAVASCASLYLLPVTNPALCFPCLSFRIRGHKVNGHCHGYKLTLSMINDLIL